MNKLQIKQIAILSAVFGAFLGIGTLIPYIGILSFLICTFAMGSIILFYLQKIELIGELETKLWSIYGAISGFVGFLGFSITFVPLATIIGLFVKTSYYLGISIMFRIGFFITLLMVLFVALISALMNGFGAMTTSYALNFYNEVKKQ